MEEGEEMRSKREIDSAAYAKSKPISWTWSTCMDLSYHWCTVVTLRNIIPKATTVPCTPTLALASKANTLHLLGCSRPSHGIPEPLKSPEIVLLKVRGHLEAQKAFWALWNSVWHLTIVYHMALWLQNQKHHCWCMSKWTHSSCWGFFWTKQTNFPLPQGDFQQLKIPFEMQHRTLALPFQLSCQCVYWPQIS